MSPFNGDDYHIPISRAQPQASDLLAEQAVVELALAEPGWGQVRAANELKKQGIFLSPAGVRCVWLRHDLENIKKRLKALETKSEQDGLILTESQVAALEKAKAEKETHGEFESECPGYCGAQDAFYEDAGEYTGAVSAHQLKGFVEYAIVGHSERRHHFGETDKIVARKAAACVAHGITPIVCVGERLHEKMDGLTNLVVSAQVEASLSELTPKEIGLYANPYSDFGRLSLELWRAGRLVVDTGIHSKRWTREQAIDYLLKNTANTEADCTDSINRYIVMPSQATAYKVGMLPLGGGRDPLHLRREARVGEAHHLLVHRHAHEPHAAQAGLRRLRVLRADLLPALREERQRAAARLPLQAPARAGGCPRRPARGHRSAARQRCCVGWSSCWLWASSAR